MQSVDFHDTHLDPRDNGGMTDAEIFERETARAAEMGKLDGEDGTQGKRDDFAVRYCDYDACIEAYLEAYDKAAKE
jgi:hypothetical protein